MSILHNNEFLVTNIFSELDHILKLKLQSIILSLNDCTFS